ncbi:complement C2 isoform X3 [Tympanuchus pallidicinctus]|uniref:complement C2 isoform X3 n=1 Tax=Tympanuchus pallidicinctus TaxID=109042 RepID=UPI0022876BEE|nr:complement C2 isoform X3 [Tympanuchus pallidicinctus]
MALWVLLLLAVLPVTPSASPRCAPQCPPGTYPHPPGRTRQRCGPPKGRSEPVRCRALRCPAPLSFPHGTVEPRFPTYPSGSVLRFSCDDGFVLRGAAELRCRPGGVWSDAPPVCDDGDPYSFDLPEDISSGLGSSFASILELAGAHADNDMSLGRRIVLSRNESLHVYVLLDASGSVQQDNFELFRQSAVAIVDRLSSFEVPLRFAIVSFATHTHVIISTIEDDASDADEVIARLEAMNFGVHRNATGTNMHGALLEVYHMILFQKERSTRDGQPNAWRNTRHVVILLTDGRFNVGGHPRDAVAKIEDVLEIREDREEYLDIYAFGVGTLEVDMAELEAVASHRRDERHAFKLADASALRQALEGALTATAIGDLCGVIIPAGTARPPWHVVLRTGVQQRCAGTLLGGRWVLTAAHCFLGGESPHDWSAELAGGQEVSIRGWNLHEDFDIRGRAAQGVPEFYDYDVALVELEKEVGDTGVPRRICIPCTEDANRALRMAPGTTCQKQEVELLGHTRVPAEFVSLEGKRLSVRIKEQEERASCLTGAVQPGMPHANASVKDVVTERFLCSGQESSSEQEDAACKGESGGSLFVERRHRFLQGGPQCRGGAAPCLSPPWPPPQGFRHQPLPHSALVKATPGGGPALHPPVTPHHGRTPPKGPGHWTPIGAQLDPPTPICNLPPPTE